jgi:hypothetical protein
MICLVACCIPTIGMGGFLVVSFALIISMLVPGRKAKWYEHGCGGVTVNLANGQLGGTLQTNDGVCGMVLTGASEGGGYTLGDTLLVTGLANLASQGITQTGNPFAYRQVKEFYDQAGDGANLYLMLVSTAMLINSIADNTNASGAKKLLNYAGGKIKVLGIMTDDKAIAAVPTVITITAGLNASIITAVANMKVMAAAFFAAQKPFRCIIGGTSYGGVPANLTDQTSGTTNSRVGILIGDTQSYDATNSSAALGLLLGTIASIPVMRKVSRVRTGALTNTAVYLKTTAIESGGSDPATIAGRCYITFTTYPNVSGYFWHSDPMVAATTDDYRFLARGRVIDKAHVLAYGTFVQEVDDEVPVNDDGTIDAKFAKWLETQIITQITTSMKKNGEISGVQCTIATNQNILATSVLTVVLKIRPVGYATDIVISLGFEA